MSKLLKKRKSGRECPIIKKFSFKDSLLAIKICIVVDHWFESHLFLDVFILIVTVKQKRSWCSAYGRSLLIKRLWFRITGRQIRWIVFTFICCKIVVIFVKQKLMKKRPFKTENGCNEKWWRSNLKRSQIFFATCWIVFKQTFDNELPVPWRKTDIFVRPTAKQ